MTLYLLGYQKYNKSQLKVLLLLSKSRCFKFDLSYLIYLEVQGHTVPHLKALRYGIVSCSKVFSILSKIIRAYCVAWRCQNGCQECIHRYPQSYHTKDLKMSQILGTCSISTPELRYRVVGTSVGATTPVLGHLLHYITATPVFGASNIHA